MTHAHTCPTCGRAYPKAKAPQTLADDASIAERYAYFKRIAPLEDAKFIFRTGAQLSPELEADWRAHIARIEAGTAGTPTQIHAATRALHRRHGIALMHYPPAAEAERAFWAQVRSDAQRALDAGMQKPRGDGGCWPPSGHDLDAHQQRQVVQHAGYSELPAR